MSPQKTVIMEGNQTALLSSIAEDMKALKGSFESLNTTVNGLEDKIMSQIRGTIREETRKYSDELELLKGRMENMETRLGSLAGASAATKSFDVNSSVIVLNLVQHDKEDVAALCQDLFRDVLGTNATVVKAERTRRRTDKPALIKCQLSNLEEKIEVLRCKKKVRETDDHKNVLIARMKTHEERLIEGNFKSILKDLPKGANIVWLVVGAWLTNGSLQPPVIISIIMTLMKVVKPWHHSELRRGVVAILHQDPEATVMARVAMVVRVEVVAPTEVSWTGTRTGIPLVAATAVTTSVAVELNNAAATRMEISVTSSI